MGTQLWIVLLFVAVLIAALTITGVIFAWKQPKDEDELPPLKNLQERLSKMMNDPSGPSGTPA